MNQKSKIISGETYGRIQLEDNNRDREQISSSHEECEPVGEASERSATERLSAVNNASSRTKGAPESETETKWPVKNTIIFD